KSCAKSNTNINM
ncbi:unnamed protein product, partial [Allacma fusca]